MSEWIYAEDKLPPLGERVLVVVEIGKVEGEPILSSYLDVREQRTGWERTIECWRKSSDYGYRVLAWLPIPKFKKKEE